MKILNFELFRINKFEKLCWGNIILEKKMLINFVSYLTSKIKNDEKRLSQAFKNTHFEYEK